MIALALVVATVLLGVAVIAGAGQVRARVEAQHAADAAALAGAHAARAALARGDDSQRAGCEAALNAAVVIGVRVGRCAVQGAVVTIAVGAGGPSEAAAAVAGPAWSRPGG